MEELQKELENVYGLLARIQVAGDAVDILAAARVGLRRCYQMAGEHREPEKKSEEGDGT